MKFNELVRNKLKAQEKFQLESSKIGWAARADSRRSADSLVRGHLALAPLGNWDTGAFLEL